MSLRLFKKTRISWQLLFWFLIIEIPAGVVLTYVGYRYAEDSLKSQVTSNLEAIAKRQANQIYKHLSGQIRTIEAIASLPELATATQDLSTGFADGGVRGDAYREMKSTYRSLLVHYQSAFQYDDFLLVSPNGDVVFSIRNRRTIGKNFHEAEFKNSDIANLFDAAYNLQQTEISGFSNKMGDIYPAAYIATPIMNRLDVVGVLMVKIDNAEINNTVNDYAGLGETGESVLVSKQGRYAVFTSNTRHSPNGAFTKRVSMYGTDAPSLVQAASGEKGEGLTIDYRNQTVLAVWSYMPILKSGLVVKIDIEEAYAPINRLRDVMLLITLLIFFAVVFVAIFVARSISKPIRKLTQVARSIAAGNLKQKVSVKPNNEIGALATSFNLMTDRLIQTQEQLQEYSRTLEAKVAERTEELNAKSKLIIEQSEELKVEKEHLSEMNQALNTTNVELHATIEKVNLQKKEIEEKNSNIISSIQYAKRIQTALLPPISTIQENLQHSFIYFQPKDIVSGDFYWCANLEGKTILAAVDCTGHGVPGAFMSVIGNSVLNQTVYLHGVTKPNEILEELNIEIRKALQQEETANEDSMDIAICTIDFETMQLEFAGARNPLFYVENGEIVEVKGDRMSVGGSWHGKHKEFTLHTVDLSEPKRFYMFSDGYRDQFGGAKQRKITMRKFKELIADVGQYQFSEQEMLLRDYFNEWKGKYKQTDDVLVIGFEI